MSMFLFFVGWAYLFTILPSQSDEYQDLVSIEVCSITFDNTAAINDIFERTYLNQFNDLSSGTVRFESNDNDARFEYDNSQRAYQFFFEDHATYGDISIRIKNEGDMRSLFFNMVSNCDECLGNANAGYPLSNLETTVSIGNQGTPGNAQINICGKYELTEGYGATVPDTSGLIKADAWNCTHNTCKEETREKLIQKYQGFEVFTDNNCISSRRKLRSRDGDWRCERCNRGGNSDGWFSFQVGSEPQFNAPDGQGQNKCNSCKDIFGDNCERCDKHQGCSACTFEAFQAGFQIINKGDDNCPWQYCGEPCCNEDIVNVTESFVCDDPHPIETPQNEHGTTNYICNDERQTSSIYMAGRYTLPLPIEDDNNVCDDGSFDECYGDCSNGVPYRCFSDITDPNCAKCNDEQPFDLRGCEICACSENYNASDPEQLSDFNCDEETYFWYSNAVPCAPCSGFGDGCLSCQDGGDHGGGGCAECDTLAGYHKRYDDIVGVWFCTTNINEGEDGPPSVPGIDGWDGLKCIEKYERRAGRHKYAFCGCNCTDCDLGNISPGTTPENPYCTSCHFHGGCGQCFMNNQNSAEDWFMPSMFHKCENCRDTFGERCMDCGFVVGCQQCQDGYELTESTCCDGLQYCEYKSRFR